MRALFHPIAGRECVYPLLFPRVGIVLQRLCFFCDGYVMCKSTDKLNLALWPHSLLRVHTFPNRYAVCELAFSFYSLCMRMFSLRRWDFYNLCVVVKSTTSSGCTFLCQPFCCLRGIFHLNVDFKAVYAFTLFHYRSLHYHMRMFFDACVIPIITQASHCTFRCCFAKGLRVFLYVWVITKITSSLHYTLMRVSTLRWRAFFTGNVSLKCACTFCFSPLSIFFQDLRVFCDTHVLLQPTNTSHFMQRCCIL
jgi:hypothetical protein